MRENKQGESPLVALVSTVAFLGLEARAVEVQVQVMPGLPNFVVVGLADKAVAESRERVRGALSAIGLALPPKRIVVNLSPADLPKEGSHYDLPIALGLLGAMGVVDAETLSEAAKNPLSLVALESPINMEFVFEDPLARNNIAGGRTGNQVPGVVTL